MSRRQGFIEKHPTLSALGAGVAGLWLYRGGATRLRAAALEKRKAAEADWVAAKGYDPATTTKADVLAEEQRQRELEAKEAAEDAREAAQQAAQERAKQTQDPYTAAVQGAAPPVAGTRLGGRTTTRGGAYR